MSFLYKVNGLVVEASEFECNAGDYYEEFLNELVPMHSDRRDMVNGFVDPLRNVDNLTMTGAIHHSTGAYITPVVASDTSDWIAHGSMPSAIGWGLSSLVVDEYVYILGGAASPASLDQYSCVFRKSKADFMAARGSWTACGDLPSEYGCALSAHVINDRVYVFGGQVASNNGYSAIYSKPVIDFVNGSGIWEACGALPTPAGTAMGTLVIDGIIYVVGGWDNTATYTNVYTLTVDDLISGNVSWTTGMVLPDGGWGFCAVSHIGEYVYVLGGRNSSGGIFNSVVRMPVVDFIAQNGSWESCGSLPMVSDNITDTIILDDDIYVVGGYTGSVGHTDIYKKNLLDFTGKVSEMSVVFDSINPEEKLKSGVVKLWLENIDGYSPVSCGVLDSDEVRAYLTYSSSTSYSYALPFSRDPEPMVAGSDVFVYTSDMIDFEQDFVSGLGLTVMSQKTDETPAPYFKLHAVSVLAKDE